jgi:hypothetical protein
MIPQFYPLGYQGEEKRCVTSLWGQVLVAGGVVWFARSKPDGPPLSVVLNKTPDLLPAFIKFWVSQQFLSEIELCARPLHQNLLQVWGNIAISRQGKPRVRGTD